MILQHYINVTFEMVLMDEKYQQTNKILFVNICVSHFVHIVARDASKTTRSKMKERLAIEVVALMIDS